MRRKMVAGMLAVMSFAMGCNTPGSARNSAIVRQVEAAGAGNLDRHPKLIAPFFDTHVELARSLRTRCSKASIDASIAGKMIWRNTTEGMVCMQAELVEDRGAGARDPEMERTVREAAED